MRSLSTTLPLREPAPLSAEELAKIQRDIVTQPEKVVSAYKEVLGIK